MQTLGELKLTVLLEILNADKNAKKFTATLKDVEVQSSKTKTSTVQLESRLQNLGLRFQGLQALAGIFRRTLGDLVASYQTQEIALAKLSNGLKNVGEGTDALKRLSDQASQLQKVTVYGNEEINSAQAMLTTFMKSSQEIEVLTPRILDLAAAFDQSGAGGKSLQEVAVMLGKVNEETIGALRRVGVAFSNEQAEKLKSLQGTQQAIYLTEILDQNFKGMAETVGKTTAGQMKIFQNQVGDLKEEWGKLLADALLPFLAPMKDFVKLIQDSPPNIKAASLALGALGVAFVFLNGSLPASAKALGIFLTVTLALPEPARGAAIAIGVLAAALKLLGADITSVKGLMGTLSKAFPSLASAASSSGSKIATVFGKGGPVVIAVGIAIWWFSELISKINQAGREARELEQYQKRLREDTFVPMYDANVPGYEVIEGYKKALKQDPDQFIEVDGVNLKLSEYVKTLEEANAKNTQFGKSWQEMTGQADSKIQESKRSLRELGEQLQAVNEQLKDVTDDTSLKSLQAQRDKLKSEYDKLNETINPSEKSKVGSGRQTEVRGVTNEVMELQKQIEELEAKMNITAPGSLLFLKYSEEIKKLQAEINALNTQMSDLLSIPLGMPATIDGAVEGRAPITPVDEDEILKFNIERQQAERDRAAQEQASRLFDAQAQSVLSLAHQVSGILGIGAETFVGKLLNGLQQGLSLANSIASFLNLVAGVGSGGVLGILGLARGGSVPGTGSGDTVPAMLTPGEFVINKSRAGQLGTRFLNWLNGGGTVQSMAPGAFAGTGSGVQIVQVPYVMSTKLRSSDIELSLRRFGRIKNKRIG